MIITTADAMSGQRFQVIGLVSGNVVFAKNFVRDAMAGMKNFVGGEIRSYTDMMVEGRAIAEQRMIEEAERLGADAIIAMRFDSSSVVEGAIDFLAYGTAVRFD